MALPRQTFLPPPENQPSGGFIDSAESEKGINGQDNSKKEEKASLLSPPPLSSSQENQGVSFFKKNKTIAIALSLVLALATIGGGAYLVRQRTEIKPKATTIGPCDDGQGGCCDPGNPYQGGCGCNEWEECAVGNGACSTNKSCREKECKQDGTSCSENWQCCSGYCNNSQCQGQGGAKTCSSCQDVGKDNDPSCTADPNCTHPGQDGFCCKSGSTSYCCYKNCECYEGQQGNCENRGNGKIWLKGGLRVQVYKMTGVNVACPYSNNSRVVVFDGITATGGQEFSLGANECGQIEATGYCGSCKPGCSSGQLSPTPLPRLSYCISTSVNPTTLIPGENATFTSASNTPVKRFIYSFYNRDNEYGPGNPKPICVPGGSHPDCPAGTSPLTFKNIYPDARTKDTKVISYKEIFVPDHNWNQQIPSRIQINGYFQLDGGYPFSLPNPNCVAFLNKGVPPTPTPIPPTPTHHIPPTPTSIPYSCNCTQIKFYSLSWQPLSPQDLFAGQTIYIAVAGSEAYPQYQFDKGRIRINESAWQPSHETTNRVPQKDNEFYITYTIPPQGGRLVIEGEIHLNATINDPQKTNWWR